MSKLGRGPVDKGVRTRMEGKKWVEHRGLARELQVGDRLPHNGYQTIIHIIDKGNLRRVRTDHNLFMWHGHRFTAWERQEYPDG